MPSATPQRGTFSLRQRPPIAHDAGDHAKQRRSTKFGGPEQQGCRWPIRPRPLFVLSFLAAIVAGHWPCAAQQTGSEFESFDELMNRERPVRRSPEPATGTNPSGSSDDRWLPPTMGPFRPLRPNESSDESGRQDSGSEFPVPFDSETPDDRDDGRGVPFRPVDLRDDDTVAPPAEGGTERLSDAERDGFRWEDHRTSVADLLLPVSERTGIARAAVFDHGTPVLTFAEEQVYLQLLERIDRQRQALVRQMTERLANAGEQAGVWEKAFYQFKQVRQLAWDNGHLRADSGADRIGGLPDPFRQSEEKRQTVDRDYDLLTDIRNFPHHFVGRPIVLEGIFQFEADVRLGATPPDPNEVSAEAGPAEERLTIPLARGTLTSLNGRQRIAMVDTRGLLTADGSRVEVSDRPGLDPVPVLVKGWVVKRWDDVPLVYCETLRQISPRPHRALIQQYTVDRRAMREQERWLYFETLRQMQLTKQAPKQQLARSFLKARITDLMKAIDRQTRLDLQRTDELLQAEKISEREHRQRKAAYQRRLTTRVRRYRDLLEQPEQFSTFVDLFQNPEVYHGRLVTLSGHVRHVVSYPGDEMMFQDGRMLHEIWLFTDDSQHNPTVVITPELPDSFPTSAEVIDRVTVTGCFFKRYVYGSQDADRIAPLILAGKISWDPTVDQVNELVADGHVPASSPLARKASLIDRDMGRTGGMIIAFCIVVGLMVLFGRAQREERDRVRLRKRINELPEFENLSTPGYALPRSDLGSESSRR